MSTATSTNTGDTSPQSSVVECKIDAVLEILDSIKINVESTNVTLKEVKASVNNNVGGSYRPRAKLFSSVLLYLVIFPIDRLR